MNDLYLQKISTLISKKIGEKIKIIDIEEIRSGHHSNCFKLITKEGLNFFLKRVASHDFSFKTPERKLISAIISNNMHQRSNFPPRAVGVILDNKKEILMLPDVTNRTEIYHIQEFETDGISYWSLLQAREKKSKLDKSDITELEKITDFINKIHQIKYPSKDIKQLKSVYNDGLRSVVTSPELTILLLSDFSESHPLLPRREHGNYIGLMLNLIYKWKDRYERLSALHGDFWGGNLFFKKDGSIWVIDYSLIPWGDPGIDIGYWLSHYLWLYHKTQNEYFKKLGEKFLAMYYRKSNDKEINRAVSMVIGLMGIIFISPKNYPNLNMEIGKKFLDNVLEILRNGQFMWKK